MVGDGAERAHLVRRVGELGLENVRILGQRPKSEMPKIWAATDVSMILLRKSDTFTKVLPSKMFEAMGMACPIVLGVEGEAQELLEAAGAGIAITPESATELAAAICGLAAEPALAKKFAYSGEAYVRRHFDRSKLAERYAEILSSVEEPLEQETVPGFATRLAS